MNSWLNELPGLHPSGKKNEVVINPDDAAALGIGRRRPGSGVLRRSARSNWPRRSTTARAAEWSIVDHGWGSRIFDPRGGARRSRYGANRNLLIDGGPVDPLSQTSALSSSYVGVERVG